MSGQRVKTEIVKYSVNFNIVICMVLLVLGTGCGKMNTFTYTLKFEEPKPLKTGERVVMNGVTIGSIGNVEKNRDRTQMVTLLINRQYAEMIRQDSVYRVLPEQDRTDPAKTNYIVISVKDPASPSIEEKTVVLVERSPWEKLLHRGQKEIDKLFGDANNELEKLNQQLAKEMDAREIQEFVEELLIISQQFRDATEKNMNELIKKWKRIEKEFEDDIRKALNEENVKRWKSDIIREYEKLEEKIAAIEKD